MSGAAHEDIKVRGFLFSFDVFGYSVSGHEKVAWRVCEEPADDFEMWDRTARDIANETINGEPVPLWWALRGANDARLEHLYG